MTLQEATQSLEELSQKLPQKIKEHQQADTAYMLRFYELTLKSGMGTIVAKEAEANVICNEEGLLQPVQVLRADVKALYSQKDLLIELSRNLRALEYGQEHTPESQ